MAISLRDYQEDALTETRNATREGLTRLLAVLPTGCGKTIIFSELARRSKRKTLILAHRDELIRQAADKVSMVWPEAVVGVVKGRDNDFHHKNVVCASVQTLSREKRLRQVLDEGFGLLVVDECFVAGTLVDGRPIESILIDDYITAWDKQNNRFIQAKVTYIFKREAPEKLVLIRASGIELVCTLNHPILVNGEWRQASELKVGDILVKQFSEEISNGNIEVQYPIHMREVSKDIRKQFKMEEGCIQSEMPDILFAGMFKGSIKGSELKNNGGYESQICIEEDERKKSDEECSFKGKDGRNFKINRSQTEGTRREWKYNNPSKKSGSCIGMGDRSCYQYEIKRDQSRTATTSLQAGYSQQGFDDGDRSGWRFSWDDREAERRCKKSFFPEFIRVDSIEILEQGSNGKFERLCSDGFVYNLEVEGVNTYTANGIVVHNCHHAMAQTYRDIIDGLGFGKNDPRRVLFGCTATPSRMDDKGLGHVFQKIVYSVSILTMIRAGYLSDIRGYRAQTDTDLSRVGTRGGDYIESQLAQAVNTKERNELVIKSYQEHAPGRKAIAFCANIQHSEDLAEMFMGNGIEAKALSGKTPEEERAEALRAFSRGEIRILTNCALFTEGFDEPSIECVLMCRPTKSSALYTQCIGRGTRRHPGKDDCIVIDFCDNRHDICSLPELLGWDSARMQDGKSVIETLKEPEKKSEEDEKKKGYEQLSFGLPPVSVEEFDLLNKSQFRWIFDGQQWLLPVAPGVDAILMPDGSGRFQAFAIRKDGGPELLHPTALNLGWGQGVCEDYVRRNGGLAFAAKDAKWRKVLASEKQVELLKKIGAFREGMSKGDATDLIGQFFARKNARKINRQLAAVG